jgi:hypothetical protein
MANLSIQTFFLFYSALSFLAAIVIAALFWKKMITPQTYGSLAVRSRP